ncbi:glycerol-3-phosphate acyltransferase 2, mitochondrial [Megalops cyprinoides]|uniref:glycerol-3-phosphate acyltransferase 2, mitochondrial n=1 Tax=Megalops cyprinoides TaxID=118141 RepID=UPI001863EA1D|nr:glycerol-3-phosphate acyltransferase 2, mitochondrial [Megalops cyprinoides]
MAQLEKEVDQQQAEAMVEAEQEWSYQGMSEGEGQQDGKTSVRPTTDMLPDGGDVQGETACTQVSLPKRPALSWAAKIKKKLKPVTPFLGKFRPVVGQCCHQCTPKSLGWKLLRTSPFLGYQDLLCVNETQTRFRGWLVRRLCCVLFVSGCRVYPDPAADRLDRIRNSSRVQKALSLARNVLEQYDGQRLMLTTRGQAAHILHSIDTRISPWLLRVMSWMLLKLLSALFCSVQVNLSQLDALHRASQLEAPLVLVSVRQCSLDYILVPLVLFCHNLRVPYTICHLRLGNTWLRSVLQRLGVILCPPHPVTEQDAERDSLYGPLMTAFVGELLREGQSVSLTVDAGSGRGGQWLTRVREAVRDGTVPDVSLVPVSISYDCPLADGQGSLLSLLRGAVSLLWEGRRGSVRIHFAQAFSLKEMCETGRCRVDGGRPLQELLLPVILNKRFESTIGQKSVSWVLPPACCPELPPSERELTIALTLHLLYSATSCAAVMSTSLVSCLLLHKHRKGVRLSQLCRDASWLLEEVLFRNRDVGFGGSLSGVMYHALSLLRPCLVMIQLPPVTDPLLAPRPSAAAIVALSQHCHLLTHVFILEAVGACAVSAMLWEVAGCGGAGEMEFDVALGQEELTERALQLCHLLPPGHFPPCQSAHSFACDAVDSLVRCGILVMEELPRDHPVCDFWKRQGSLMWRSMDDADHSDSDCEEQESRSYKLNQPSQCPDMLFFLCSLLSVQLRALSWAIEELQILHTPLPESECVAHLHVCLCDRARQDRRHYESSSADVVRAAVRTLIDLGVLKEKEERGSVYLGLSPLFQQVENRSKLHSFVCQFLYN